MFTPMSSLVLISFVGLANAAVVNFDCTRIPETCNNMCFASNRLVYFEQHYDSNTGNKDGRRQAAGCLPNPNRCNSNPPAAGRTTCDEYPFASTHGTGNGGWFSNTGATTRCVSTTECNSQGGSLSAFYQSFGRVDQTPVDVTVSGFSAQVAPFCNNAGMASDGQFATGGQPPNRREDEDEFGTGVEPPNRKRRNTGERFVYLTSTNRTILSLTGPLDMGSEIFVPNHNWESNLKVRALLEKRQDTDNDVCSGTSRQAAAASMLTTEELGSTEKIVQRI
ncbi:hypothetical protein BDQ12DRAFT_621997 [Crucibulum laeve]|uniref:Deoxyribonuclease NucA/NucB domain-containing protein n=1 Tax=Crucibulum laeve TaxID=68775 RepID=A0A5C3MD63_9AGAR|nr:hypothetical protein BDQ12DRAFT_621997 [Crucibulum laeve]